MRRPRRRGRGPGRAPDARRDGLITTDAHLWLKQVGLVALGALLATAMVVLGVWQLDVYRAQGDATAQRRAAEAPVALTAVAPPGAVVQDGYGRTVRFSGHFEPQLQVLVPLPDGSFRVVTGLRQADDSVLAVVRGVSPGEDAPAASTAEVTATGILLPSEEVSGPVRTVPAGQLTSVRLPTLAQTWPGPLVNGFVTLDATAAAQQGLAPAAVNLPEAKGRLRNGAYALQWWVFAAFALGMSLRVARDVGRVRSEDPDEALIG